MRGNTVNRNTIIKRMIFVLSHNHPILPSQAITFLIFLIFLISLSFLTIITPSLLPSQVGAAFPIWGLLLASVEDIFYYTDTTALREAGAVVATRFIMLGINCLIGYTLQYYCIAQVGQRISTGESICLLDCLVR